MLTADHLVERLLTEDLEARLPYLLKQFPEQNEDTIRDLAVYDPYSGRYMEWILTCVRDSGPLSHEAGMRVREILVEFERVKKLSAFTGRKDINDYASFEDLGAEMEKAKTVLSKKAKRETGLRQVAEWRGYKLWLVTNIEAAMKFAQNSRLCFCDRDKAQHYAIANAPLYVMSKGTEKLGALSAKMNWFFNMDDQPLTGFLRKAAKMLVAQSSDPELIERFNAWYSTLIAQANRELTQARETRHERRRQAIWNNLDNRGVGVLGHIEHYEMVVIAKDSPLLTGVEFQPDRSDKPLVGLMQDGQLVAWADGEHGRLNASPEHYPMLRQIFDDWSDKAASDWVRNLIRRPAEYAELFDSVMDFLGRDFTNKRAGGYTDRDGNHQPGVGNKKAAEKWESVKQKFVEYVEQAGVYKAGLKVPSLAFAQMLGYEE